MIDRLAGAVHPKLLPLLAAPVLVVALVGLAASSGGDGGGGGGQGPAPSDGGVAIQGFAFAPKEVTVAPGTEVVWTNGDGADHTVEDGGELFEESEVLGQGDEFRFTYDEPGTFPYVCGIHNYMTGVVTVEG